MLRNVCVASLLHSVRLPVCVSSSPAPRRRVVFVTCVSPAHVAQQRRRARVTLVSHLGHLLPVTRLRHCFTTLRVTARHTRPDRRPCENCFPAEPNLRYITYLTLRHTLLQRYCTLAATCILDLRHVLLSYLLSDNCVNLMKTSYHTVLKPS